MEAMRVLCNAEQEQELCTYSLTPLDGSMQLDIASITKMLSPGQAAAAYEVLLPGRCSLF
jgi:hypothetical protein